MKALKPSGISSPTLRARRAPQAPAVFTSMGAAWVLPSVQRRCHWPSRRSRPSTPAPSRITAPAASAARWKARVVR